MDYFDIHSHLNFDQFNEDRDEVITEMKEKGIATICVGTDPKTSRECIALAEVHNHIWATVGIHPTDWEAGEDFEKIEKLSGHKSVVAIGECGLDYYRNQDHQDEQKHLFKQHVQLARNTEKPMMLHGRPQEGSMDAYEDILDILADEELPTPYPGHVHFFVGSVDIAQRFLGLGFTIGFDGPITFSREYAEVIRAVPLDMMMAETDAPFAAPEPFRGRRNSPLYLPHIIKAIADIRDENENMVRTQMVKNAKRTFNV